MMHLGCPQARHRPLLSQLLADRLMRVACILCAALDDLTNANRASQAIRRHAYEEKQRRIMTSVKSGRAEKLAKSQYR